MSETGGESGKVVDHTLEYLRRMDRRQSEFGEMLMRRQELLGRLDRDMREGFARVHRDLSGIKSDIVVLENKLLNRMDAELDLSRRPEHVEDKLSLDPADTQPKSIL